MSDAPRFPYAILVWFADAATAFPAILDDAQRAAVEARLEEQRSSGRITAFELVAVPAVLEAEAAPAPVLADIEADLLRLGA